MGKHLILIHGRSTKPRPDEKQRLAETALRSRLAQVSPEAETAWKKGDLKVSLAYYGDLLNNVMMKADPKKYRQYMEQDLVGDWYEKPGSYDTDLEKLISRPTKDHTKQDYRTLIENVKDLEYADDAVRAVSSVVNFVGFGLGLKIIEHFCPDLALYGQSRVYASKIRQRLQKVLVPALLAGDEVAIVGHSMGTMVAYDVLWKLCRMSEYEEVQDKKIPLFITLGSPLGEPALREALYDAHEPKDGKYPTNIEHWVNFAAQDDFVAHDATLKDDFREMIAAENLEDAQRIYNFWSGYEGSNPHKFYGYLNHPAVAKRIGDWITAP